MTRASQSVVLALMAGLISSAPAWTQSTLQELEANYQATSAQLEKHLVDGQWIDDEPHSAELLARQWALAGQWTAAWLDSGNTVTLDDLRAAVGKLASQEATDGMALNETTFLLVAPSAIGNVFIVTRSGGHYRPAWSSAQPQETVGRQAEILAAWRAENAQHGGRGPYWAASGRAGPVFPRLGRLPDDASGRARFYIDGMYAQGAGGTAGAQITPWIWDGVTAHP